MAKYGKKTQEKVKEVMDEWKEGKLKTGTDKKDDRMIVHVQQSLDSKVYDVPLTLKTYIPDSWKNAQIQQAGNKQQVQVKQDAAGKYILYEALPGNNEIEIVQQ